MHKVHDRSHANMCNARQRARFFKAFLETVNPFDMSTRPYATSLFVSIRDYLHSHESGYSNEMKYNIYVWDRILGIIGKIGEIFINIKHFVVQFLFMTKFPI